MTAYALPGAFPPLESSNFELGRFSDLQEEREGSLLFDKNRNKIEVDVARARIDARILIESLAASNSTSKKITSPRSSRTRRRTDKDGYSSSLSSSSAAWEEAMRFELSVTFDGRHYSAVRSLPTIQRLRDDLVNELPSSTRIPELPCWEKEAGENPALRRWSFSFLDALLRSYSPALEGWFHQVVTIVPPKSSLALSHFLWEPDGCHAKLEEHLSEGSFNSSGQLDAIEESDESELDDEEESS